MSLASLLVLASCLGVGGLPRPSDGVARLDLLRPWADSEKVYVELGLPDGSTGLFLVDTGASVSAVTVGTATRLGLEVRGWASVSGLGGTTRVPVARLDTLDLGGVRVKDVDVWVGVPGMSDSIGFAPLAGILGNNVLGQFAVAVDYPAAAFELGPAEAMDFPEAGVEPMIFDGAHVRAPTTLVSGTGQDAVVRSLLLEVDTGARQVLLSGSSGRGFEGVGVAGREVILGIGSSNSPSVGAPLRDTIRVPLESVRIGGQEVRSPGWATWVNPVEGAPAFGPPDLAGLVGYAVLKDYRVLFDFPGERFVLVPSRGPGIQVNLHQVLLDRELAEHGRDPDRGLERARLRLGLDDPEGALSDLQAYRRVAPGDLAGIDLAVSIHLGEGRREPAMALLRELSPVDLARSQHLTTVVNGLSLAGEEAEARAIAEAVTSSLPDMTAGWLVLGLLERRAGRHEEARRALVRAGDTLGDADALAGYRAFVAASEGDPVAALSWLRRTVLNTPYDGESLWFYALEAARAGPGVKQTLAADLATGVVVLHDDMEPLDFVAFAWTVAGDTAAARAAFAAGVERDCRPLDEEHARDNCHAWYRAMVSEDLDTALAEARRATAARPERAGYLDTLAVVHWRRGELTAAAEAALRAASLNPESLYMLWQAEWMAEAARGEG